MTFYDDAIVTLGGARPTMRVRQSGVGSIIVSGSTQYTRDPRLHTQTDAQERLLAHLASLPQIQLAPPDKKWCACCGEWMSRHQFSPKADAADGLHPYCKPCRAERKRRGFIERE